MGRMSLPRSHKMPFASGLWTLLSTKRPKKNHGNCLFLNQKSFRLELARERMRVDRSRSPLAVLTIELPADRATSADFDFLARGLVRGLRNTDAVGFLARYQVGVLLPDTSEAGAWKVASDICDVYPVGHDRPNCEVFVYPDDSTPRRGRTSETDHEHAKENTATSIESLLIHPTPKWKRAID